MSKVLYATDYSHASRNVLSYAASMARDRQASLLVVHVLEMEEYPVGELFDEDPEPPSSEVERLEEMTPTGFDIPIEHRLIYGQPGRADEAICKLASDEAVELIVIGTHGETMLEHVMGGSVAERIIKNASCPVAAVKHR